MPIELLLIRIIKALAELAGLFLLGQGLLYVLAGAKRDANIFYQLLAVLTRPVMRFTRWITPRAIADRHIPLATFMLVFWIWVAATAMLVSVCIGNNMAHCR